MKIDEYDRKYENKKNALVNGELDMYMAT